jgi:MerR family mercuric resistance operon transcriptional regulator
MRSPAPGGLLQRGELARLAGCNPETVRFYEKIRLMPAPLRTSAGYRAYGRDDEERLRFILRARHLGFAIEEIRQLFCLAARGAQGCGDVREITRHHLAEVRQKMADLRYIERTLARLLADCSKGGLSDCPVIDALSDPRIEGTDRR